MGRRARKPHGYRDVDGILLLNKPIGLSSNKALQVARNLFKANKAGHTGSLDPLATGLLPICFGEATKFSGYLLDASKSYRAICQLGQTSSTGDGEGEISSALPVDLTEAQVQQVTQQFIGKIQQIPPMHSAVKHQGERLYTLARQGIEVERKSREIEIYSLDIVSFEGDQLELDVHCSKGTYIRTLAEDIGQQLGCGAYLAALERTGVQPFWNMKSYSLDELRDIADDEHQQLDDCLLPMEAAISDWPAIELSDDLSFYLRQGQPVQVPRSPTSGYVRLLDEAKGFIGAGIILADGRVAPKRMLRT
jgi:tRNA pseudouridine55 synthase